MRLTANSMETLRGRCVGRGHQHLTFRQLGKTLVALMRCKRDETFGSPSQAVEKTTHPEVNLVPFPLSATLTDILHIVTAHMLPPSTILTRDHILVVILLGVSSCSFQSTRTELTKFQPLFLQTSQFSSQPSG